MSRIKVMGIDTTAPEPIGSHGFRKGTWTAILSDGSRHAFYGVVAHDLTLDEQREELMRQARQSLARSRAAAMLGAKGGASGRGESKRRNVDYAALGRKGGLARGK